MCSQAPVQTVIVVALQSVFFSFFGWMLNTEIWIRVAAPSADLREWSN